MPDVDINYVAVLAAAVVNMVVGMAWYSESLFGKSWSKLTGRSMDDMRGSGAGPGYAIAAVGALLQAYILAHFVQYAAANTVSEGAITGFWIWLGFVAVVMAVNTLF